MTAIKETLQAGKLIFTKVTTNRKSREKRQRAKRKNPTSAEVAAINQKNAERDLSIKLHANFGPGDIHAVLTYSGEAPDKEEAKKKLNKFKRDLKKKYAKYDLVCKWIEVTEYERGRIHHHVILKRIPIEEIVDIWPHGYVRPTWLDDTGDYRKLASYLLKETSKTFRDSDAYAKRRYRCSRTVVVPEVRVEEVRMEYLFEAKATKGYQVDQDSIWKGINPATDRPYIEYVQISLLDDPKKYKRGKRRKYRPEKRISWADEEEQLRLQM